MEDFEQTVDWQSMVESEQIVDWRRSLDTAWQKFRGSEIDWTKMNNASEQTIDRRRMGNSQVMPAKDRMFSSNTTRSNFSVDRSFSLDSLPSGDSFRLLELHAGSTGDMLCGEITTSTLKTRPTYAALSYVWRGEIDNLPLSTQKGYCTLSRSAAQALKAIRQQGDCTFIWVDEICINQQDKAEIATQMLHVGDIFKNAQMVYLWQDQAANTIFGNRRDFLKRCWPNGQLLRTASGIHPIQLDPFIWRVPERIEFQHKHSSNIAQTTTPLLSREEFIQCQRTFRSVIVTCSDDEFRLLALFLSAILSSMRLLTFGEIVRIVVLAKYVDISSQPVDEATQFFATQGQHHQMQRAQLESLLHGRWTPVLSLDIDGYVRPATNSMYTFLKWIEIPGIHKSHAFMANICLKELELSTAALQCIHRDNSEIDEHCAYLTDFSAYCLDSWQTHYQAVQSSNPALSARLHAWLWPDVTAVKVSDQAGHESINSPCSVHCRNCLELAIAYCKRRGFFVLTQTYEQMKAFASQTTISKISKQEGSTSSHLRETLNQTFASQCVEKDNRDESNLNQLCSGQRLDSSEHCRFSNHEYSENSWVHIQSVDQESVATRSSSEDDSLDSFELIEHYT